MGYARRLLGEAKVRTGVSARIVALCVVAAATSVHSRDFAVAPEDYEHRLASLEPGDSLTLAPGVYRKGLVLHGLHGSAGARIVIQGPPTGPVAVLLARDGANTVSLADSSYITVRDLVIDGAHLQVDAVKAEGGGGPVHDITLQRLTIVNHDFAQDVVAISTKGPAWGWVIRDNTIIGAGTGVYLGDSDGTAPFFDGLIENNLIVDSIGYDIEIKHQIERPMLRDAPVKASLTVLRNNVFAKTGNASVGDAARPNVLVGHFPLRGPGSSDSYEITGNVFFENATESLFQGEGNVTLTDNVFFNPYGDAIVIQPHHDLPRRVRINHNFVAALARGITVSGGALDERQEITGNAVYADQPLRGGVQQGNAVGSFALASPALKRWFPPARDGRGDATLDRLHLTSIGRRACALPGAESDSNARSSQTQRSDRLCRFLKLLADLAS